MTLVEKLKILQRLSGFTQEQLAREIGVTFAALNRWFNAQAKPRPAMLQKIDELYREYSGEKIIPDTALAAKKRLLLAKRRSFGPAMRFIIERPDLRDQFDLSLTYHSNRIEGSSLTENETGAILFHNKALPNKSLVEQLGAKNHQTALHFLFNAVVEKNALDEEFLQKLHAILMNGIHPDAGRYRRHGVRIVGTRVVTANYVKVPILMKSLMIDIRRQNKDIVAHISSVHARFEQIHPFADGNGRVGRLIMHAMLLQQGFPPAIIRQENRRKYFTYLHKAQIGGDFSLLEDFLCDAVIEGFQVIET